MAISLVTEADLDDLLPLFRGYCDFYGSAPSDEAIRALARALVDDPEHEGVQLLARDDATGAAIGFATVYWLWSSTRAVRIALMNDLFVAPEARGTGTAEALIEACRQRARDRGCAALEWQTAPDNHRAQKVYDRVGGERSTWLTYEVAC